jgi:5-methylcytosine-specific restriction endonuclease McrA
MAFSDEVQRHARRRAHGTCECTSNGCPHFGRCRLSGTEFHHKRSLESGGTDEVSNCTLLCRACHQRLHGGAGTVGKL